jgi:type II secretory pathway pseudopilin PulG
MSSRRPRNRRQKAALLTEVLIALALLIPVVVIVAGLFPYSFSVDRKAWNQRTAQSLARSALEEARGQEFDSLDSFQRSVTKDGTTFQVELSVNALGAPDVREKDLVCTVSWPRKNGVDTLRLESKVAKLYQGLPD